MATVRQPWGAPERAGHHDDQGYAGPRWRRSRWALFGRIHGVVDGRGTAREYAGADSLYTTALVAGNGLAGSPTNVLSRVAKFDNSRQLMSRLRVNP